MSRADAPAIILDRQLISPAGQIPIPFELSYDPRSIVQSNTYVVRAQIREGDRLIFTTTQSYRVITQGNPTRVGLVLEQV